MLAGMCLFDQRMLGRVEAMAIRPEPTAQNREAARKACTARADARAIALASVIAEIKASGITGPNAIAAALNARGIRTARGALDDQRRRGLPNLLLPAGHRNHIGETVSEFE
jgi:hypothetical protein